MEDLYVEIAQQLSDMGIDKENISWSTRLTLIALILLISYIITKLFRHLVIPAVHKSYMGRLLVQRKNDDQLLPYDSSHHVLPVTAICL